MRLNKRAIAARLVGNRRTFLDRMHRSVEFESELRRFENERQFDERMALHEFVASGLGAQPVIYLEFGVWRGESFRKWLSLNNDSSSSFVGFDTFTGLPEDWVPGQPRGTFSTNGVVPEVDDTRARFVVGLFQETLYEYLDMSPPVGSQLVVHIDCDLYSSTLFVLAAIDRFHSDGTVIIFDDYGSLEHEFGAWCDYRRAFSRPWRRIGSTTGCRQAAFRLSL